MNRPAKFGFLRIFETPAMYRALNMVRSLVFLSIVALILISAWSTFAQTPYRPPPADAVLNSLAIEYEHRFTKTETTLAEIYKQVNDIQRNSWIALLGIIGLAGETGIRLGKRAFNRNSED